MALESFGEHLRRGYKAGNIKIRVPIINRGEDEPVMEHLWARPITPTTAKVLNIPFYTDSFCLGDLIEHRGGEIIRVRERGARTYHAAYEVNSPEEAKSLWPVLKDYLAEHDIRVERFYPGLFGMAVPVDISPERLMEIAQACPVTIECIAEPTEHGRF
jgi:hypothetical protein